MKAKAAARSEADREAIIHGYVRAAAALVVAVHGRAGAEALLNMPEEELGWLVKVGVKLAIKKAPALLDERVYHRALRKAKRQRERAMARGGILSERTK